MTACGSCKGKTKPPPLVLDTPEYDYESGGQWHEGLTIAFGVLLIFALGVFFGMVIL